MKSERERSLAESGSAEGRHGPGQEPWHTSDARVAFEPPRLRMTQVLWTRGEAPRVTCARGVCSAPQLVLASGAPARLRDPETWAYLRGRWPASALVVGSTAGEICGTQVFDDSLVATALEFRSAGVRCARVALSDAGSAARAGAMLAEGLVSPGLRHVFLLSDGLSVNGSELVSGVTSGLPAGVSVTGGLCGDGARFERTYACLDEFAENEGVVGVGFYGDSLRIGFGSLAGWDSFGLERRVTRSRGNVVYEFDGQPALDLYERYLGEQAKDLPASGLLFPLTVRATREEPGVVRTILAVDKLARSLTYAGDVPTGHHARLMRANFDRLVEGAGGAARAAKLDDADIAVLVSCVGRKLVLKQRVEEEVESVRGVLGPNPLLAGFYSYGEMCPFIPSARCELHNQTMTITTISER